MADTDFVIPDTPTSGTPPSNFLLVALPRDESDLSPRSYQISDVLKQIPDDTITDDMLSDEVRGKIGSKTTSTQYAATNSDDDSDWHTAQVDDDEWVRIGIGDPAQYSAGIALAGALIAGDGITITVEDDGTTTIAIAIPSDIVAQYAETNSDTDSDWHTTQVSDDGWIRFGIGDPAVYTEGIPLTSSTDTVAQYAITNSDDDSDWHITQSDSDFWIRFGIGDPVVYTDGIPLVLSVPVDASTEIGSQTLDLTVRNQFYVTNIQVPDADIYEWVHIRFEFNEHPTVEWHRVRAQSLHDLTDSEDGDGVNITTNIDRYGFILNAASNERELALGINSEGYLLIAVVGVSISPGDHTIEMRALHTGSILSSEDGGGRTNLSITDRGEETLKIASNTGTDAVFPASTKSLAGAATAEQVTKLEAIEEQATKNAAGAGTTIGEDGEINIDNEFTEDDKTKLDAVEEESTKNAAGDGLDESDDGTLSVDNGYIDDRIDAADQWFDHFRTPYTPSFATDMGHRWQSIPQSDGSGHYIRIQPGDAHQVVLRVLVDGSKIQVRNENGTVRNTFTLEQDPFDPDVNGVWELYGDWEHAPSFDEGHNYTMYYSARREASIFTDDDTIEGTGLHDNPARLKDQGIRDEHIAGNLTDDEKTIFKDRIGAVESGDQDASGVGTTTSEFGKHVPDSADNVQKALKALNDNDYFIRYTVERSYSDTDFFITDSEIHLAVTSGTLYDLCLNEDTGDEALPANYVRRIGRHTRIKLVSGDTVWRGEVLSHRFDDLSVGGASSGALNILTVDFAEERTGTFVDEVAVQVSIGYAVVSRFIASDIPLDVTNLDALLADFTGGDLQELAEFIDGLDLSGEASGIIFNLTNIDGMLADVTDDNLQTLIDFIDNLTAEHMFVDSDEFEGLLDTDPAANVVQQALEVVDQLGDHDEDNHFFSVTPADLTNGKIGYAAEAHTGLNSTGGSQASHSLIKGLFHEYDADKGYRWHLLYDDDATGIGGTDDAYGGPALHALDGSGATGRILNIFFKVGDRDNNRLFNPYAGGIDLDPNSQVGLSETLTVFEIIWNGTNRRFEFRRHLFDTGSMSGYWESATDPLNESKDIWVLTQDDGLVRIDSDWFDDAGSTYARWIVPDTETTVLAALNGMEDGQHGLVTVADEDSVGTTPDYVRTYDHGFYLQLKIGSDPIETKWLKPASYNPGVWNWVSDWEQLDSAPTTVGTAYEAAVYDVEGAGQFTADDEVTLHEELARKDQLGPTFVTFRHNRMDDQYKEYRASDVYPFDSDVELSRRNIYQPRKFVFGRVEGSSNGGLPIPEIDFRDGSRGNVDYHQGEVIGSDLLDLTAFRPKKGTWRVEVDINALTYQELDKLSIALLRVNTDQKFYIGNDFVRIGISDNFGISETDAEDIAIDSDGNAFIIGMISDCLSTLNLSTGVATPVTTTTGFNVGENNATGLAITEDDTVFMIGRLRDILYTLSRTTGNGTQVGTLASGFGVSEMFPSSLAARGNELFMSGEGTHAAHQLNTSTGVATRIGNITNYGLDVEPAVVKLFVVNDRIFFYESATDAFYELDERTGEGILIGSAGIGLNFEGLAEYGNVIYAIRDNQLHYTNILDLPTSIGEGIGVPIISRYNFPGRYSGENNYSVTAKLVSSPFYTDGTQDFTLAWNLAERVGETLPLVAKDELYNWLARDFKVHMERLAA